MKPVGTREGVVCLGEYGIVAAVGDGVAAVEFDDGSVRNVSTAVLVVDGVEVAPGDRVLVSMGMALRVPDAHEQFEHRTRT